MAEMAMQNWPERLRLVFHTAEEGRAGYVKPVQLKGSQGQGLTLSRQINDLPFQIHISHFGRGRAKAQARAQARKLVQDV